ncbi:MAG: TlpA disulfide reductase family protein [Rhodocyclaceae bacterium]|nr:TlpA disulfide reductase family protein [Rhodocyclaceae bacterium]
MRFLLGALLVCCSLFARAQNSAPLFAASLPDQSNQTVALADFRGKPLIVNFWARWCAPCRDEIPELRSVARNHRAKGLTVIGIGLEANLPNVQDFIKAYEMDYLLLFAPVEGISLMQALGNGRSGLPFTLAIDRNGRVVMHKLGKVNRADLEQAAAAALK